MLKVNTVLSFVFFYLFIYVDFVKADVEDLVSASVMVQASDGSGTGVAYHNDKHVFIWTDAHVVDANQHTATLIDPKTGNPKVFITYDDVWVMQEEFEDGRKVGEKRRLAKIIRFSKKHDIAILKVYGTNFPAKGVDFIEDKEIPKTGTRLWHVGCLFGAHAINTPTEGIFSKAGRLRKNFEPSDTTGVVYDHFTGVMHPGSSGGAVFLQSNEKCIGLVTEFTGPGRTPGTGLMSPARRLREFSIEAKCEWAMNRKVKVPEKDLEPVSIDPLPIPPEMKPAPVTPSPTIPTAPPMPINKEQFFIDILDTFRKIAIE